MLLFDTGPSKAVYSHLNPTESGGEGGLSHWSLDVALEKAKEEPHEEWIQ